MTCKECNGAGAIVDGDKSIQCLECADTDFADTKEFNDLHLAIANRLPAYVFPNAYDDDPRSRKALSVDEGTFRVRGAHVDIHDLAQIVSRLWTVSTKSAQQVCLVRISVVAFTGYAKPQGGIVTTLTLKWSTIR